MLRGARSSGTSHPCGQRRTRRWRGPAQRPASPLRPPAGRRPSAGGPPDRDPAIRRPVRTGAGAPAGADRSGRSGSRAAGSGAHRAGHNPGWCHVCVFAAIGRKRRRILRTGRSRSSPVPRGPPSHGHGGTVAAPSGGGSQWPVRADPRPARLRPSRCRRHRRPHPAVRAPASAADGRPRAPVRRTAVPHHPPT
jgi:hypothetical protein